MLSARLSARTTYANPHRPTEYVKVGGLDSSEQVDRRVRCPTGGRSCKRVVKDTDGLTGGQAGGRVRGKIVDGWVGGRAGGRESHGRV